MIKRTDSTGNWFINDSSRNPSNVVTQDLYPNLSDAEGTNSGRLDILSNGFKIRDSNADRNTNTATYIYAAFAENPFKLALAR